MKYHKLNRYPFWMLQFWKNLLCRIVGHQINNEPGRHWCQRCLLAYEECYQPKNYYMVEREFYEDLGELAGEGLGDPIEFKL